MSTAGTGPSGNQAAGSQASGASLAASSPTGASGGAATGTQPKPSTTAKLELPAWMRDMSLTVSGLGGIVTILLYVWLLLFHVGAAMLSYRRSGSAGWAIVNFFFASFYYPYYALVVDSPAPAAPAPLIGGMLKGLFGGKSRRR